MNIDALIKAQIDGKVIRASYIFRMATDPIIRLWTGVGDINIAASGPETTGGVYQGLGVLTSMPEIENLTNGTAQRVEFALSGVDANIVALADADAEAIRAKQVNIGLLFMGEDWQPLAAPLWLWQGDADVIRTNTTSGPDFSRERTVTLSVGSLMTGRRRPKLSSFTRAQQRRRSADDAFCDRTRLYSIGSEVKWP